MLRPSEALRILEAVAEQDPERPRSFHNGHVLLSIMALDPELPMSRDELQDRLGLGGGAIRSLISRLVMNHLLVASPSGMRLKGLGSKVKSELSKRIVGPTDVKLDYLRLDVSNTAYLVRGTTVSAAESIVLRDSVVRYGGTGGTACISKGDVAVPGVTESLEEISRTDVDALRKLKPGYGDLIFISSAPSRAVAASSGAAALFDFLLHKGV